MLQRALLYPVLMFSIGVTSYSPIVWHRPKGSSRIVWKCAQNNSLHTILYKLRNLRYKSFWRVEVKFSNCIARSYPAQRIRHFCIGDSLPPREQTWLLIKMELPCSPSSCVFNNTSTYYCSQTQISQSLNYSKCFPDQEYSNGERLILEKKCEYGKHAREDLWKSMHTCSRPLIDINSQHHPFQLFCLMKKKHIYSSVCAIKWSHSHLSKSK